MKKGFTLVELMVVIAIIALLTGIILVNLTGSKAKGRDAKRVSDLAQIQLAIEQYFDRCNQYPTALDTSKTDGCPTSPTAISLGSFISKIPTDPSTNASYDYMINSASAPTNYLMHTTLETSNSASQQSAPLPSLTGWSVGSGNTIATCDTSLNYCARPN